MTAKPKIGRPRRTVDAADERITFRVTADELAELRAAAGSLALGDWIRDAALAAARQ